MSYVARLSYNYKQKYFCKGLLEEMVYQKLSPNTRWGEFCWIFCRLEYCKKKAFSALNKTINEFKVRVLFETGNTEIGNISIFWPNKCIKIWFFKWDCFYTVWK